MVVDPSDPSHLVARGTYGVLRSTDGGGHFGWVCEQAIGYGGQDDPMMGVLSGGALLAALYTGLSASRDGGCTWSLDAGVGAGFVADLVVSRSTPTRALLVRSASTPAGFTSSLVETTDGGVTWSPLGATIEADFVALTVEIAPSAPSRLYVSGLSGYPAKPVLARSDDDGTHWAKFELQLDGARGGYLGAISPVDPDRVYLRTQRDPTVSTSFDALYVSDDGGASFTQVFEAKGDLLGFTLSPDGERVAVGGPDDGVVVASTSELVFTQRSATKARCLTWAAAGLYACGFEPTDGFALGLSVDEGATFAPLHRLADACPIACPSGSGVDACSVPWRSVAASLGKPDGSCGLPPGERSPAPRAEPTSPPVNGATPTTDAVDEGCATGRGGPDDGWLAALVALVVAAFAMLRGRRRAG